MSFIRTAVFSQPGGAAWALGHAQSLPLPGKRWWKYFQQTLDCVGQDLNQFPGAVIQVGWERLVHLHAEWMGIVFFHKEILGSVADVKPIEIDWKALGITWVWGQSPGSLVYVPIWLLPQKTTCRCPWEWESWLSQLSFLLGYQGSASIKWTSSARKMFPAIYFFSHWLYGNTVPFFSWHPSWCLPFLWCIPSPPFIMKRGCPDALAQNWFALGKKKSHFSAD